MNKTHGGATVVQIGKAEMWMLRALGTAILAFLGWIGTQFHAQLIHVAEIRKELEVASPVKMMATINTIEAKMVTEEDVTRLVRHGTPWQEERGEWLLWKSEVIAWKKVIADSVSRLDKLLELRTANRWTAEDMHRWAIELERQNPAIKIPPLPRSIE